MDYKQKYEEAIEQAKKELQTCGSLDCDAARQIFRFFPELKKSENEKIRKWIRNELESKYVVNNIVNNVMADKAFDWLEKKGEKTIISHKFNIGDWIVDKLGGIYQIKKVMTGSYSLLCANDVEKIVSIKQVDNTSRLLCISDIKKLEKQGEQSNWKPSKDEMDALYGLAYITNKIDDIKDDAITKLYQDLKREFFNGATYENIFPSDKVEPKFKVGDWIVRNYSNNHHSVNQVINVKQLDSKTYGYTLDDGTYFSGSWDSSYNLWTIQDAKDGDVLCYKDEIFIVKMSINLNIVYYCCYDMQDFITNSIYSLTIDDIDNIKPATKEQRDLLFQKMKEAGYKWDEEKKELKKIKQNTTWSEEDEEMINNIIDYMKPMPIFFESTIGVRGKEYTKKFIEDAIKWLEFLKERIKGE